MGGSSGGGHNSPNTDRGGAGAGPGLGLTVGKTMYGNTAYGPAGGKATGYASVSPNSPNTGTGNNRNTSGAGYGNPGAGGGFAQNNYSNFRSPNGSAMFGSGPGAPGGSGVYANGGMRAAEIAKQLAAMARPAPARAPGRATTRPSVPVKPRLPGVPRFPGFKPYPDDAMVSGWISGPNFWNQKSYPPGSEPITDNMVPGYGTQAPQHPHFGVKAGRDPNWDARVPSDPNFGGNRPGVNYAGPNGGNNFPGGRI